MTAKSNRHLNILKPPYVQSHSGKKSLNGFGKSMTCDVWLIVCLRVNQVLCYSSLIYGPSAFASPPVSNYSRCFFILCFHLSLEWIYACTEQFPDGPYIGDCMVFSETANYIHPTGMFKHWMDIQPHWMKTTSAYPFNANYSMNIYSMRICHIHSMIFCQSVGYHDHFMILAFWSSASNCRRIYRQQLQ